MLNYRVEKIKGFDRTNLRKRSIYKLIWKLSKTFKNPQHASKQFHGISEDSPQLLIECL